MLNFKKVKFKFVIIYFKEWIFVRRVCWLLRDCVVLFDDFVGGVVVIIGLFWRFFIVGWTDFVRVVIFYGSLLCFGRLFWHFRSCISIIIVSVSSLTLQ